MPGRDPAPVSQLAPASLSICVGQSIANTTSVKVSADHALRNFLVSPLSTLSYRALM
jgi:hypothetical protein